MPHACHACGSVRAWCSTAGIRSDVPVHGTNLRAAKPNDMLLYICIDEPYLVCFLVSNRKFTASFTLYAYCVHASADGAHEMPLYPSEVDGLHYVRIYTCMITRLYVLFSLG